uniref:Uncharacterized protein n=1 Tax=Globodera pallida TaxID=36090 RepID=A0A183CRZ7_GLOPA
MGRLPFGNHPVLPVKLCAGGSGNGLPSCPCVIDQSIPSSDVVSGCRPRGKAQPESKGRAPIVFSRRSRHQHRLWNCGGDMFTQVNAHLILNIFKKLQEIGALVRVWLQTNEHTG